MVTVLAFDCAGGGCAAAVVAGGCVKARRAEPMERGQAAALMPMLAAVIAESGMGFAGIDLLAVTIGPGGFTGLRIGLAAARGLMLATGRPLIGITSFAAIAAAVPPARRHGLPLAVALESKRAEVYLQCFAADGRTLTDGALVAPADAAALVPPGELLLAGDAAARLQPMLGRRARVLPDTSFPDPADIAALAAAEWRPGEHPAPPLPLYLRAPDTTQPRRGRGTPWA